MSRLLIYGAASSLLASLVVSSALSSRSNFYSAAVSVCRSSGSLMILANFCLFLSICVGIGTRLVFFGQLRAIENEHLYERLWMFITESLLALTIFRDDFSLGFGVLYGVLVFLKSFHWITADRVDYMDQIPPPGPPATYHLRALSIMALMAALDLLLVTSTIESVVIEGVSPMVLFASEFAILLSSIGATFARYVIGVVDLRRARGRDDAPPWEKKSMWLFYVDLAQGEPITILIDLLKLLTYLTFFLVIVTHYGLPLHILRDVWMTCRSFLSRCQDLVRYRRATKDMDALYPNATAAEMERQGDKTCIICRDEMVAPDAPPSVPNGTEHGTAEPADPPRPAAAAPSGTAVPSGPNETPKKLQCGHIFHFHCLRSWLERQQSCPTCRRDVLLPQTQPAIRPRINPPLPAPGAAPQPPAAAGARPRPLEQMRRAYSDFFGPPQAAQGPAPAAQPTPVPAQTTPVAAHAPTQAIQAGSPATAAITGPAGAATQHATASDGLASTPTVSPLTEQLQRGICGGRVTPGRFWGTALNADSRFGLASPPAQASPLLSQPSTETATITTSVPPAADASDASRATNTPSSLIPPPNGILRAEPAPSGSTTPSTSQAPEIFTSTAGPRQSRGLPDEPVVEEEEDGVQSASVDPGEARRQAAEAALRRFGGTIGFSARVPANGPTKGKARADPSSSTSTSNTSAHASRPDLDSLDTPPQAHPYLEPLIPPQPAAWGPAFFPVQANGAAPHGVERALDERLRVLREVDEVVWGLIGELTRLRSGWDAGPAADGVRGSDGADESGPMSQ